MQIPLNQYWALLKKYLQTQWKRTLLLSCLLLGSIALQLVNPQIIRSFIDAAQEGANWVRLELPVDHAHRGRELSKMGFVRRQGRAHVALTWCATDALALARDNQPWSLTNAHAGWYQLT